MLIDFSRLMGKLNLDLECLNFDLGCLNFDLEWLNLNLEWPNLCHMKLKGCF